MKKKHIYSIYFIYSGGSQENNINKTNKINIYFIYFIYSGASFENRINKLKK